MSLGWDVVADRKLMRQGSEGLARETSRLLRSQRVSCGGKRTGHSYSASWLVDRGISAELS